MIRSQFFLKINYRYLFSLKLMRILANTETRLSKKTKQNKKHVLQHEKKSQHNLLKPTKNGDRDAFFIFYQKC